MTKSDKRGSKLIFVDDTVAFLEINGDSLTSAGQMPNSYE